MIERIIEYSARNRAIVLMIVAIAAIFSIRAMINIPLDAIPDLSDVQVIVFTEWQGRSPDVIEDQVTYPIVTSLLSAPKVKYVRGQTFFGLSFVYVIFEDGTDMYWARSRVLEYMNEIESQLPAGVSPTLGPDATGVGWVYEYALIDTTGKHNLAELRSFQDWSLKFWLESVPGVAEVASVGGFVKQYQVEVNPNALLSYGIPLSKVIKAVREANNDVGGRTIEIASTEFMIRGRGYIKSIEDIENVPLGVGKNGTPIFIRNVADVHIGPEMRRGIAELDGKGEVVGGIVIMRYGENALKVIERVKAKLADVKSSLPPGMEIVTTYDRSDLINRAIDNLIRTLLEEGLIVSFVIILFLAHFRSALVPIFMLPTAVLLSFSVMDFLDLTSNIMSLGGIVIAIGATRTVGFRHAFAMAVAVFGIVLVFFLFSGEVTAERLARTDVGSEERTAVYDLTLQAIGDARVELEDPASVESQLETVPQPPEAARRFVAALPWVLCGVLVVALLIKLVGLPDKSTSPVANASGKSALSFPPNMSINWRGTKDTWSKVGFSQLLAISRDGRRIIQTVQEGGRTSLYLKEKDDFTPREVPGTEGARGAFFSPDGQWVGFADEVLTQSITTS
ncbi:MAG: efflux RND transporter permease subunit, partial [Bacteroidetes bacterium]|nr:efflux RND transporter permease subunit [Bacteroidota bacterium]